LCGSRNCEYGQ